MSAAVSLRQIKVDGIFSMKAILGLTLRGHLFNTTHRNIDFNFKFHSSLRSVFLFSRKVVYKKDLCNCVALAGPSLIKTSTAFEHVCRMFCVIRCYRRVARVCNACLHDSLKNLSGECVYLFFWCL